MALKAVVEHHGAHKNKEELPPVLVVIAGADIRLQSQLHAWSYAGVTDDFMHARVFKGVPKTLPSRWRMRVEDSRTLPGPCSGLGSGPPHLTINWAPATNQEHHRW